MAAFDREFKVATGQYLIVWEPFHQLPDRSFLVVSTYLCGFFGR